MLKVTMTWFIHYRFLWCYRSNQTSHEMNDAPYSLTIEWGDVEFYLTWKIQAVPPCDELAPHYGSRT